jgi:hypothetical protein
MGRAGCKVDRPNGAAEENNRTGKHGDDRMAKGEMRIPKSGSGDKAVETEENRPRNLPANTIPTDGYGLEVDGKMKSRHDSSDAAWAAGLELKRKFPLIQVKVFAAKEQTRTIVELPKP